MRGIASLRILHKLEEMTKRQTYELFDVISGTGMEGGGVMLTILSGIVKMDINSVLELFEKIGRDVFNKSLNDKQQPEHLNNAKIEMYSSSTFTEIIRMIIEKKLDNADIRLSDFRTAAKDGDNRTLRVFGE